jgi:hypothetical protein
MTEPTYHQRLWEKTKPLLEIIAKGNDMTIQQVVHFLAKSEAESGRYAEKRRETHKNKTMRKRRGA